MKFSKHIVLSLLTITALAMAKPVLAAEASQEQNLKQECEVICEVGSYGQNTSCINKCYQEGTQKQSITLSNGTVIKPHQPINTGLDVSTGSVVASLVMTGSLAAVARRKIA